MVPAIADAIKESRDLLTDETARLMVREIMDSKKNLGMECDVRTWWNLAEFLLERKNENK